MFSKRNLRTLLLALIVVVLIFTQLACITGGGGGSDPTPEPESGGVQPYCHYDWDNGKFVCNSEKLVEGLDPNK